MAQRWGDEYFHFFVEALPRITLALDILREHLDIKVSDCVGCREMVKMATPGYCTRHASV